MSPRPGRNRLALWLVTLSARRWPPLLPGRELQAAVINQTSGAVCTGSRGHTGPGQRERGAAGRSLPAAESAFRWHTSPSSLGKLFMLGPWPPPPAGVNAPAPPSSGGSFLWNDSFPASKGAPGSAAVFGAQDWTGLHFSLRMPNPLS